MMNRRTFIAAVAGMSLPSGAQQPRTRALVGYLSPFTAGAGERWLDAFRNGLREQGYSDGVNVDVEARYADEHYERLGTLASELIARKVDVLFAVTTPAAVAAQRASASVPIVFTLVSDPVRTGLVKTLAHPGGNVTGTTDITADLVSKRLALLKEAIPGLVQVGVLENPDNPTTALALADLQGTARSLGLELHAADVRREADVGRAFAELIKANVSALVTVADASLSESTPAIVRLASTRRLPVMGWNRGWVDHGAVYSYGTDAVEVQRQAASMVARILRGTKPADLPVEQPTKFELIINVKAAKALGLAIPPSVLTRANEVIQ